ncbi:IS4 family transposase [Embleya sp. NPDC127516]|uniref:IS4 family transposase n=1 Tax=Embleya sp. NPDC127516 TaxID=3363990 RepID=UPI00380778D9
MPTEEIGPEPVDEIVESTGCPERRRRLLPARAVVCFVLALCLFGGSDSAGPPGYRSVLRAPTEKLRHLPGLCVQHLPTSSALTRARQRLGEKPLRALFERRCGTLATTATIGAFAFGLRLVAWDGTVLDVPDNPVNARGFGFTGKDGANQSGHPQVRLMALTECGTHAPIDAAFDAVASVSEHRLTRRVPASLRSDMLLSADRNLAGYGLWGLARSTGAHLAWRIKKNPVFVPLRILPDGSYPSVMGTPAENQRRGTARAAGRTTAGQPAGHLVRIVEYTVTVHPQAGPPRTERFRPATGLPDHRLAPTRALAAIHHERWGIGNGFAELKTRLRGAGFIPRSRAPELVRREIYALLTVHQALCAPELRAAEHAGIDPDRISFAVTVQLARLKVTAQAATDATTLNTARREVVTELLAALLPTRRDRQCQRVKKPSKNTFEVRKRDQPRTPSNVRYTLKVTRHPT